jgi:hypothetical protein
MASALAMKMGSAVAFSAASAGTNKQASITMPFVGLKAGSALPIAKKAATFADKTASNSGRVQCMKVRKLLLLDGFSSAVTSCLHDSGQS